MSEKRKKIDWKQFTSEEINLKKIDLNNTYQMLHNMCIDMLKRMDEIESEFNNANIELENRGF
jgi:hypothetical protein